MKKILIFATMLLGLCSCEKWLEATSSTQFKAETIFETRYGFHDALSGIYINMGDENAYGGSATWKYNDLAAYPYENFSGSTLLSNYLKRNWDNTYVKSAHESMWMSFYNCIANVNMILENLDDHRSEFSNQSEFNWVKGECLALRAYLHFDLLRMFGTCGWTDADMGKLTVPYVTSYSMDVTPQRTYAQTDSLLEADLDQAIELLADDPVTGVYPDDFENGVNSDGFWNNRTKHLNLYAAMALKARVYQWKNDYADAAKIAQQVIDAVLSKNVVSWLDCDTEVAKADNDSKDWTFSCEHIFTLEVTGLYSISSTNLIPSLSSSNNGYRLNMAYYSANMFPNNTSDLSGLEDMRGPAYTLSYLDGAYISYKLYGNSSSTYRNRMPMVKLSEMYYMVAENDIAEGKAKEALSCLNTVRKHRGITSDLPETSDASQQLCLEYMREFLNEGQFFYFVKHRGETYDGSSYPSPLTSASSLIYPYPDDEIYYGRKQEL